MRSSLRAAFGTCARGAGESNPVVESSSSRLLGLNEDPPGLNSLTVANRSRHKLLIREYRLLIHKHHYITNLPIPQTFLLSLTCALTSSYDKGVSAAVTFL